MKGTLLVFLLAFAVGIKLLALPSLVDLLELKKCPACYGTSLCEAFLTENITWDFSSIKAITFNIFGSRNVLFGIYLNERVVLKKLGHRRELDKLDETICIMNGLMVGCKVNEALKEQNDLLQMLEKHVIQPYGSSLHLCPTAAHLKNLLTNYDESKDSTSLMLRNLWTVLSVNPEPLILQVLRAENGWPVPKYKGACGRVIVEEFVGEMLYTYHGAPWIERANFAFQLLMAALNFTNDHPDFSFYLTDISPDNIAVDPYGNIKFIDLENVIIVDKSIEEEDKPPTWIIPHVSERIDCESDGCFAFSPEDICAHRTSDHNVYAVCQTLLNPESAPSTLPGGLLHGALLEHTSIMELVTECIDSDDRFITAQRLMTALQDVIQKHSPNN